jgi:uncharacterized protein YceK
MKHTLWQIISILLILLSLAACSTVVSKAPPHSQFGSPYSGIQRSGELFGSCSISAPLAMFPPAILVTVPLGVADFALSVVADTLFLPIDFVTMMTNDRKIPPDYVGSPCFR